MIKDIHLYTLYNVVSSDGFIARLDGSEDFIPDDFWPEFIELCKHYGALIMGRKTYNAIQEYSDGLLSPFERLSIKRIVISSNQDFCTKDGYIVVHSPEEAIEIAPNALVSSGPTLNNFLIKKGLIKKIILREIPVAIEEGIKPFDVDIPESIQIEKRT